MEKGWTNKRTECLFHTDCGVQWQGVSLTPKGWMGSKLNSTISWKKSPPRTFLACWEYLNWWISRTWERIEPHFDCSCTPSLSISQWSTEVVWYLLKRSITKTEDGCSHVLRKAGNREGERDGEEHWMHWDMRSSNLWESDVTVYC